MYQATGAGTGGPADGRPPASRRPGQKVKLFSPLTLTASDPGPKRALFWALFGPGSLAVSGSGPKSFAFWSKKLRFFARCRLRQAILGQKGPKKGPFWSRIACRKRQQAKKDSFLGPFWGFLGPQGGYLGQGPKRSSFLGSGAFGESFGSKKGLFWAFFGQK